MNDTVVAHIDNMHKSYGSVAAVRDVTFEVHRGEIFGMVGPNGAGKTTTIECVEGLRQPDTGSVRVLGLHPRHDRYSLRQRIGVQLQQSMLQPRIKVWEAIDLFSSFYSVSADTRALLQQFDLADKRATPFAKLSGGQKQRLHIALALVHDPEIIFLDELTTGLDPQARHAMWDLVRGIRDRGKTIFLTTHFMEEAERLCDRVAVMDGGRIVALDTPENLVRSMVAENRIVFTVEGTFEPRRLGALEGVSRVEMSGSRVIVYGRGDGMVGDVVKALSANGIRFRDLRTEQPSLEDAFLKLTGRALRE